MREPPPPGSRELDPAVLKAAARRRLRRRETGGGSLVIPAVPSLASYYAAKLLDAFAVLSRPFSEPEAAELEALLARLMKEAWAQSPYSRLMVRYETSPQPDGGVNYNLQTAIFSVADEYNKWVQNRPQPFFGALPNAKVLEVARSLGPPADCPILDVGSAEGRNTLPLARLGFPTDAVEIAPAFAKLLIDNLANERLTGRVYVGDVLNPALQIPANRYALVVIAGVVVAHFREPKHLRALLERMVAILRPGGQLLFSIFLAQDGFEPDQELRELAELFWTVMFTPRELSEVVAGLPLELVDDTSYVEYERTHMPESWPPTDFFEAYCAGLDLFDLPAGQAPLEMRWLTYRKQ
jgi:SAM-dependent methyltransferase